MRKTALAALIVFCIGSSCFAADKLDVCGCKPRSEKETDYRYAMKHIPLPDMQPQTVTVQDMLEWDQSANLRNDAPRKRRELQLVVIPRAYVQFAWAYRGDCDIHIEISETPDKDAPRAIVETPVDPEYCPARTVKSFRSTVPLPSTSPARADRTPLASETRIGVRRGRGVFR